MMGVYPNQLPALLEKSLAPVYLFGGSEPLLLQECRDQVIRAAQQQGFAERTVHEASRGFDWHVLAEDSAVLSLFSSRKIIDLRLPTGRPGREGSNALVEMVETPDPDILLMVSCEKWDSSLRKSKWAATLAKAGVLVEIWPVKPNQLPQWIRSRMTGAGLDPEPEAISMLADLVEGNLLAAQQEIEKLVLLKPGARITAADVSRSVANSARFDAFRLVECALLGQLGECLRVASGLHRSGVAIQAVSGALYRELTIADTMRAAVSDGESESAVFNRFRIWPARQAPLKAALQRLSEFELGQTFRTLALIDRQSKGRAGGDPWQTLDRMLWHMCDPGAVGLA
ncbi:DNA polymerase III subunit delta [Pseudomonadota bacterium]